MRNFVRLVVPFALLAAACGGDRSGGPRGDPTAVVSGAPAKTVAAGTARLVGATKTATATGTVDFRTGRADVTIRPAGSAVPLLSDPAAALDVVRAMASVVPYGGSEVRGASTIRYELDVAPSPELLTRLGGTLRRPTFYADVFIDAAGRIRRLIIPVDLNERRPSDTHQILAKLVTIDFYDFGTRGGE